MVLADDGRHIMLGRAVAPSAAGMARATASLKRLGFGGWLVAMTGDYDGELPVTLNLLRELAPSSIHWDDAVAAFNARRRLNAAVRG